MKKSIYVLLVIALTITLKQTLATECQECVYDYCTTYYPSDNDGDGDGMNDNYELQLARTFKPRLFFDQQSSEIPWNIPSSYSTPYYAAEADCGGGYRYVCVPYSAFKCDPGWNGLRARGANRRGFTRTCPLY